MGQSGSSSPRPTIRQVWTGAAGWRRSQPGSIVAATIRVARTHPRQPVDVAKATTRCQIHSVEHRRLLPRDQDKFPSARELADPSGSRGQFRIRARAIVQETVLELFGAAPAAGEQLGDRESARYPRARRSARAAASRSVLRLEAYSMLMAHRAVSKASPNPLERAVAVAVEVPRYSPAASPSTDRPRNRRCGRRGRARPAGLPGLPGSR